MYTTSNNYSAQINKPLRNTSHVKIKIFDLDNNIIFEIDTTQPSSDIYLIDTEWTREIDTLNTKLPIETFTFSFYDYNQNYNPENLLSSWVDLEKKQPIEFSFGYTLDDNTIEWVDGSKYVTTGNNSWEVDGKLCKVTIESKSIISYLENTAIKEGKLSGTYYNIINNALTECDLSIIQHFNWTLDSSLNDYNVYGIYNDKYKLNEVLQLLAQGANCKLCTGRSGEIIISPFSTASLAFKLDFSKMKTIPNVKKYPILQSLSVSNYVTIASTTAKVIGTYTILRSVGSLIVNFDKPYEGVFISQYSDRFGHSPTLTIIDLYTVKVTGNVRIDYGSAGLELSGKEVTTNPVPIVNSYEISDVGDICEIDNPFITSIADANRVATNLTHYLKLRNEYKDIDNRGYPEIDVGDIIKAQTLYSNEVEVLVFMNKIIYDGTLKGSISFYLNQEG